MAWVGFATAAASIVARRVQETGRIPVTTTLHPSESPGSLGTRRSPASPTRSDARRPTKLDKIENLRVEGPRPGSQPAGRLPERTERPAGSTRLNLRSEP